MSCSHNLPKAAGDSRFWNHNLGCLMASLKLRLPQWPPCASSVNRASPVRLSPSVLPCFVPSVPSSGRWHSSLWWQCPRSFLSRSPGSSQPERSIGDAALECCLSQALENCTVWTVRKFSWNRLLCFCVKLAPVDACVGCILLKRETKLLLCSHHDLVCYIGVLMLSSQRHGN